MRPAHRIPLGLPGAAFLLVGVLAGAPQASAHLPGSAPLVQFGNTTLAPTGQANSTLHAYMDEMGLPPSVGDVLQVEFAVDNGTGLPILFEVHTHAGATGYKVYYNKTAALLRDNWSVPELARFMVYFENPYNFSVSLTYRFVLLAPPPDTSALLFIFPATAGLALGWFFFVRAGRGLPAQGGEEDAGVDEHEEGAPLEGSAPPNPGRPPGR